LLKNILILNRTDDDCDNQFLLGTKSTLPAYFFNMSAGQKRQRNRLKKIAQNRYGVQTGAHFSRFRMISQINVD